MKKLVSMALVVFALSMVMVSCNRGGGKTESAAAPKKTYTLRLSTQLNESSLMVQGFKELAESVKAKSDGRLEIQIFPSAQLGSDEDVIEQAIQGVNVCVLTDAGRMGNYVSDMGIVGMAYFGNNYDEVLAATQSKTFAGWVDQLAKEDDIRVICFNWYDGSRSFYTDKAISAPADLKGVRIRTPGAPAWAESVTALGATPVAMPWPDTYSAIQSKAIDGCEVQLTSAVPARLYEVVGYMNKTEHFQLINGLIVGEKWFKTLPEDLQQLLVKEAQAEAEKNARIVESEASNLEAELVRQGMKINELDKTPFIQAADAAYEKLGFTELRTKIYEEIGKN